MNVTLVELRNVESLDRFLELSKRSPVVIFKHSETCGISDRAYREMLDLAWRASHRSNIDGQTAIPIGIVAIQTCPEVSNEIEARTSVDHESPQVLVIADRKVVWSTSHGGVRAEAIEGAVREAGRGSEQLVSER